MTDTDGALVDRAGQPVHRGRISPALRTAIKLIVEEGLPVADAAIRTAYKVESLHKALCKPHVRAFRSSVKRAWLASKTERAYVTVANLAEGACSEDVRLKAARVLIDMDQAALNTMPAEARQLVQIVTQSVNIAGHLPASQMSGVIESPPFRVLSDRTSNSPPVGCDESEPDDGV